MLELAAILRPLHTWDSNLAKLKCNKTVMFKYSCPSYSFSLHYNGLVVRTELILYTILLHIFPVLCFLIIYSGDELTIQQYSAI
jgi:hypothetical protein